jgi:hypothetical protein
MGLFGGSCPYYSGGKCKAQEARRQYAVMSHHKGTSGFVCDSDNYKICCFYEFRKDYGRAFDLERDDRSKLNR